MAQVGAAPRTIQNIIGDPFLGIMKFDDPWGYHKFGKMGKKLKLGAF